MDLGIALPTSGPYASTEAITHIAQRAEQAGYASLWTYERLLYPLGDKAPQLPESYASTFEPLETLSFVAAHTTRIKLGTSIINTPFHTPIVLARRFATLDQLSGGRVIAGLGQGWMEEEFLATNVTTQLRGKGAEEFIEALRAIWQPDPVSYEGTHYRVPLSRVNPKPVQAGGIPILMGVASPLAIRRAARIADGINPIGFSLIGLKQTVESFRAEAEKLGRNPDTLQVVVRANVPLTETPLPEEQRPFLGGSAAQIVRDLEQVRSLKINHVFFSDTASTNLEDATRRIEELQAAFQA
jgi:probable F420-dependent oxidoreductase